MEYTKKEVNDFIGGVELFIQKLLKIIELIVNALGLEYHTYVDQTAPEGIEDLAAADDK